MNRLRPWVSGFAILAVLVMPVTAWAHARAMADGMPCATRAMVEHAGHGAGGHQERDAPSSHHGDCCDLCFLCATHAALPPLATLGVAIPLVQAPVPLVRPVAVRRVLLTPHALPFPLGPPPASA